MRRLITLATLSLLAACGSSYASDTGLITGSSVSTMAGTYNLVTVSGASLPLVMQAANPKIELTSEQIVVDASGTFTVATNQRVTNTVGEVINMTQTDAGTFATSASGTTFRFNSSNGRMVAATLSGNTLTLTAPTSTSVYVR